MINRMRMAGLAGALLGLVVSAAVADDLETVEKRICTAWAKHRSATATIAMQSEFTSDEHHMTSNGQGTYEFLRQGDKLLARTEMRSTMTQRVGEQEMSSQQQVLVVVDGQWAHTYAETTVEFGGTQMPPQRMATKRNISGEASPDPRQMLADLHKDHSVTLLPEDAGAGQKLYVLEARPKHAVPGNPIAKMVHYFDQDSGCMAKLVMLDERDKPIQTITYSDYKFDVDIKPERFVFVAPPGVQVVDQTGD
jgi:outer membrane lipoprotein-sorting protein